MNLFLQFFKNLRFKQKLFLSYIIVVIIPLAALGLFYFNHLKSSMEGQAEQSLNVAMDQMANDLKYKVGIYNNIIDYLAYDTRLQQFFSNEQNDYFAVLGELANYIKPLLSNVMHLNYIIEDLKFYNENNVPEYDNYIRSYDRVKDTIWYKEASENTSWYFYKGNFFCTRRLIDFNSNKRPGVFYLKLDYDKFFEITIDSKADEYGILITDGNNLLFSKDAYKNKDLRVPENVIKGFGNGISSINGIQYLAIKRTVPETSWIIYYYTPLSMINRDAQAILRATVFIIGMCLIALVFIIWLFSNTFVKRIYSLNRRMKQVQEGNLQVEVSSNSSDEIGELSNNFGIMLKKVNNLIEEVYQSRIVQKEAEFKALQAQINPHFLYNILSLINWKAKMVYATDISKIANTVSKFYRTTLNNGENIISIENEILNTKSYIEIQLIMHDDSFDVTYDFDQEIFRYNMIKLVLQPIVENAIIHGIDKKRAGRGKLKVSGVVRQETIELLIGDNGPGIEAEFMEQILTKQSKGYGLVNVQERIKLFFGNEYGIHISSTLDEGTLVVVTLPKNLKESA